MFDVDPSQRRRFTPDEANQIRDLYVATRVSMTGLSEQFETTPSTISRVLRFMGCYDDDDYPKSRRRAIRAKREAGLVRAFKTHEKHRDVASYGERKKPVRVPLPIHVEHGAAESLRDEINALFFEVYGIEGNRPSGGVMYGALEWWERLTGYSMKTLKSVHAGRSVNRRVHWTVLAMMREILFLRQHVSALKKANDEAREQLAKTREQLANMKTSTLGQFNGYR